MTIFQKIGARLGFNCPKCGNKLTKVDDGVSDPLFSYGHYICEECNKQNTDSAEVRQIKKQIFEVESGIAEINSRYSGRSTRQMDDIIQKLFETPDRWIMFRDHYGELKATRFTVNRIRKRLQMEHHLDLQIRNGEDNWVWLKLSGYDKPNLTHELTPWYERLAVLKDQLEIAKKK